jgi:hypothetical protein
MGINLINNISIIIRILFVVTLFQHNLYNVFRIFSMQRVRYQQGIFISSSKNSQTANSVGQSQEGKENIQPNYLSPTTSFLAKKRPETSTQESEIVQVSMHTKVPPLEELFGEQYSSKSSSFIKHLQKQKMALERRWKTKMSK